MLAIEVNLLMGRYYASEVNNPDKSEWPPHPARLYLALVSTWADADNPDGGERQALEWLEAQPAPRITASDAWSRSIKGHFVPVNDTSIYSKSEYQRNAVEASVKKLPNAAIKEASGLIPENRLRQERTFPSVTPKIPTVAYAWEAELPSELHASLDYLTSRLTRLGHSASLVSCTISSEAPPADWIPGSFSTGGEQMRWVREGQLEKLIADFEWHQGEKRRKLTNYEVSYKKVEPDFLGRRVESDYSSTSGDCYFFELLAGSRHMPISQTVRMASTFRAAIMHYADDPIPTGLSGHEEDGRPTASPHVLFSALPNVGGEYGDGRLMGIMMVLPPGLDSAAREAAEKAIANWEKKVVEEADDREVPLVLQLGRAGTYAIRRERGKSSQGSLAALRKTTWARTSQLWRSVTPIALPTHPGNLHRGTVAARNKAWSKAEEGVRRSCVHVGLSEPEVVNLSSDPLWRGSRPVGSFPVFRQGNNKQNSVMRERVHAEIIFSRPVTGPLLLGSGRYLGLGLMRPARLDVASKAAASDKKESNDE